MMLRFYRFMETIFRIPAIYFSDMADAIDTDLHDSLRESMLEVEVRIIRPDAEDEP